MMKTIIILNQIKILDQIMAKITSKMIFDTTIPKQKFRNMCTKKANFVYQTKVDRINILAEEYTAY